jgi:hypothetical protein
MIDYKTVVEKINKVKPLLKNKYGVKKIGIFGSVARNQQTEKSDIDILVEIDHIYSLFELGGIYSILEEELKEKIDLADINSLYPEISDNIKNEVKYL